MHGSPCSGRLRTEVQPGNRHHALNHTSGGGYAAQLPRLVIEVEPANYCNLVLANVPVVRDSCYCSNAFSPRKPTMYIPAHFAESRPEEMHRIMRDHPLGALVTHGSAGLDADHIPFEFDAQAGPQGTLIAHVARSSTLWRRCPSGTPVMVIFRGAEGYISPNWYPSKHESHRQVPTWNYQVVHAHGTITVHDDQRFVRRVVAQLTRRHESQEPRPWKMGDSAPEYINSMLRNIVGIEIAVTSLVSKVKLSQNRELRDRLGAADSLDTRNQGNLAQAMRRAE